MSIEATTTCPACGCGDFLLVRSEVLPDRPVTLAQCEDCGAQYSTGELPWLGLPLIGRRAQTSLNDVGPESTS